LVEHNALFWGKITRRISEMDDVEKAKETVSRLEGELAKATDWGTALQTERRKLSFAAHNGDDTARKKLDKLTAESVTIGLSIENLNSAIDEARVHLVDAERAQDVAQHRANAAEVRRIAGRIEERGVALTAALADLCNEFDALEADLEQMRALKAPAPQRRLVQLAFGRAFSHRLQKLGIDVGDVVPPLQRYSPGELTAAYVRQLTIWSDSILGVEKVEAA
jgi:hypothetical protein